MGQTADLVDNVDGFAVAQMMLDAVKYCRHDPHEAAVAVGALVDVAGLERLMILSYTKPGGMWSPAMRQLWIGTGAQ